MKRTRLRIGVLLTAALIAASATYAFANAPNPNATANISQQNVSIATQESGSTDIGISQNNIVDTTLTATIEGDCCGAWLATACLNIASDRVGLVAFIINEAGDNSQVAQFTMTEAATHDAILPITTASVSAYFANHPARLIKEGVCYGAELATAGNLVVFANFIG